MQTSALYDQEQTLLHIVRLLPSNRVEQLVDFARFLETQVPSKNVVSEEDPDEIDADNARWDALLATDEAQDLLEKLASEALAEHREGKTRPMAFAADGRVFPG